MVSMAVSIKKKLTLVMAISIIDVYKTHWFSPRSPSLSVFFEYSHEIQLWNFSLKRHPTVTPVTLISDFLEILEDAEYIS